MKKMMHVAERRKRRSVGVGAKRRKKMIVGAKRRSVGAKRMKRRSGIIMVLDPNNESGM